jgi:hypothetical protein
MLCCLPASREHDGAGIRLGVVSLLLLGACGGNVLDVGTDWEPPRYATPETVVGEGLLGDGGPTEMATHQYGTDSIAVDDARVYWTTRGLAPSGPQGPLAVVRSCVKADCAATVVTYAATRGPIVRAIAVRGSEIFWSESMTNSAIRACPVAGCAGAPRTVAADVSPSDLLADDSYVYWMSIDSTIQRCRRAGCDGSPELVTPIGVVQSKLAEHASELYWFEGPPGPAAARRIMTVPKDGSAPARVVVDGLHMATGLAVDATNLYWLEVDERGAVKTCPRTGCVGEPTVLASEQTFPQWLAVDAKNAYWFNFDETWWPGKDAAGRLVRCPLTGCGKEPLIIATNQVSARSVALDPTHVYWTNFGAGTPVATSWRYFDGAVMRARIEP